MAKKTLVKPKLRVNVLSLLMITASVILTVGCIVILLSKSAPKQDIKSIDVDALARMESSELSDEKLRQEILKLHAEREQIDATVQRKYLNLLTDASFITALVAVIGVFITLWRTSNENTRQRELDRQQRDKEREQQEAENLRRLNEQLKDLSAEQQVVRVSAAVSLRSFLHPGSVFLNEAVYWVLLANLTIKHDDEKIYRFLVNAFEKAIKLQLEQALKDNRIFELSLARAYLRQINLSTLHLSQTNLSQKTRELPSRIDLGFANLQNANLTNAELQRVRGIKVNLQKARLSGAKLNQARLQGANLEEAILRGTNLIAADLKYANLRGAQFQNAHLQSAHFNKTDLREARFEGAELADAYFYELRPFPNDDVLKSILKAHRWEDANYDKKIWRRLILLFLELNPVPNGSAWNRILKSRNWRKTHYKDVEKSLTTLLKQIHPTQVQVQGSDSGS